ncbi:unnamed protein product, partial [marine sediment metagenome]
MRWILLSFRGRWRLPPPPWPVGPDYIEAGAPLIKSEGL